MNDQDYIEFEAYLTGNLDTSALEAFKAKLQTDAAFKEAFQAYKTTSQFLESHLKNEQETEAFKSNLESISSKYFKSTDTKNIKKKRINPWFYSVAAAAIVVIGFFIAQQYSSPVYDDFANYGTISLTVRTNNSSLLSAAENAFNNKNYTDANTYFAELIKTDSTNLEWQLYQAVSLVELNNYQEADVIFNRIIKTPSVYKNKATWYLALSKLKQENIKASIAVLKTIPENAEDYKQAQKLLNKLE